jgi:hypothetical protein
MSQNKSADWEELVIQLHLTLFITSIDISAFISRRMPDTASHSITYPIHTCRGGCNESQLDSDEATQLKALHKAEIETIKSKNTAVRETMKMQFSLPRRIGGLQREMFPHISVFSIISTEPCA